MTTLAFSPTSIKDSQKAFKAFLRNATPAAKKLQKNRNTYVKDCDIHFFDKETNTVVYVSQPEIDDKDASQFCIAFSGRKKNPLIFASFGDYGTLKDYVRDWFRKIKMSSESTKKAKNERLKSQASVDLEKHIPIGSIFANAWGCDQTIVDFYQVVGHKGKSTVLLQKVQSKTDSTLPSLGGITYVLPKQDAFVSSTIYEKRIKKESAIEGDFLFVSMNTYSKAKLLTKNQAGEYDSFRITDPA